MNLHLPQTEEAKAEALVLMGVSETLKIIAQVLLFMTRSTHTYCTCVVFCNSHFIPRCVTCVCTHSSADTFHRCVCACVWSMYCTYITNHLTVRIWWFTLHQCFSHVCSPLPHPSAPPPLLSSSALCTCMQTKSNLVTPRNGEPLIAAIQDFITGEQESEGPKSGSLLVT